MYSEELNHTRGRSQSTWNSWECERPGQKELLIAVFNEQVYFLDFCTNMGGLKAQELDLLKKMAAMLYAGRIPKKAGNFHQAMVCYKTARLKGKGGNVPVLLERNP